MDHPRWSREFVAGHKQVLLDYGVKYVFSSRDYWLQDDKTLVCIALDGGKIVGGTRLEQMIPNRNLPIEESIHRLDENISTTVSRYYVNGTSELCGLWMNQNYRGSNLSLVMSRYLISQAHQLSIESIFCLSASYTFWIVENLGFEIVKDLGNEGMFNYPTDEYRTGVWLLSNLQKIGKTDCPSKDVLALFKENPTQQRLENELIPNKLVDYESHF